MPLNLKTQNTSKTLYKSQVAYGQETTLPTSHFSLQISITNLTKTTTSTQLITNYIKQISYSEFNEVEGQFKALNQEPGTRNLKLGTRNLELGTWNPEPET